MMRISPVNVTETAGPRSGLKILGALSLLILLSISLLSSARAQLRSDSADPIQQNSPTRVRSLQVRIVTKRSRGAGTDNVVYFDIGPVGWKLGRFFRNDFEGGDDDTYELKIPDELTTEDILWLRLHKKGLFGVTGTKDGISGAWHPESVILLVNGTEFMKMQPDHALNSRCWFWRSHSPDKSDLDLFARSLRIRPNDKLDFVAKALSFLTTNVFKKNGISGWISDPAKRECGSSRGSPKRDSVLCVTGEVIRKARSTDGLETIDVKVAQIESCPEENKPCVERVVLNQVNGLRLTRYIRVESRFRSRLPIGKSARICGRLRWDTDREGWWEIHPRTAEDLQVHLLNKDSRRLHAKTHVVDFKFHTADH